MRFMLDTNICIYIIKRQPDSVLERFNVHPVGEVGISIITLAELEYGVNRSSNPTRNRGALEQFISSLEVAPFDRPATLAYGAIRSLLEKKGSPIDSMDLLIAAHALSLGIRLVTNNVKEFKRVPDLSIETWT